MNKIIVYIFLCLSLSCSMMSFGMEAAKNHISEIFLLLSDREYHLVHATDKEKCNNRLPLLPQALEQQYPNANPNCTLIQEEGRFYITQSDMTKNKVLEKGDLKVAVEGTIHHDTFSLMKQLNNQHKSNMGALMVALDDKGTRYDITNILNAEKIPFQNISPNQSSSSSWRTIATHPLTLTGIGAIVLLFIAHYSDYFSNNIDITQTLSKLFSGMRK